MLHVESVNTSRSPDGLRRHRDPHAPEDELQLRRKKAARRKEEKRKRPYRNGTEDTLLSWCPTTKRRR